MRPVLRRVILSVVTLLVPVFVLHPQVLRAQTTDNAAANSPSVEEGLAAFKAGRNRDAERIWTPLAESGDPVAQYSLGKLYETGGLGAPDFEAAARWYALAAQQDMAAAQNNLGLMYAQGRGVPRDPVRASQLWSRSANASNPMAQYNLGLAYFRGDGVGQDQVEAAVWFHLAADAGVSEAQFALGQMHRLGMALPQDANRALSWYQRAAEKGHEDARIQAERLEKLGVKPATTPDPVEQAAQQTTPAAQSAQTNRAAQSAQTNRAQNSEQSLVTESAPQSAPAAPLAADAGGQGFQLQSRLIPPAQRKPVSPAPETPEPPSAASGAVVEKPAQAAQEARAAPRTSAAEPQAPQAEATGTFLWLLSASSEAEARSLLLEAEKDYASVLEGQELTLLKDGRAAKPAFYRLVVAASSSAQAVEICAKIRQVNALAFCSTLVR